MYSGHLNITRENFREVNKICHVFNATWMSAKCVEFFADSLRESKDSYSDLKDLFGEAMYFCEEGRSVSLVELWKNTTGGKRWDVFTREYLEYGTNFSDFVLKTFVDQTRYHSIFLDYIISDRISKANSDLDRVSKYLIQNMNMVGCFEYHAERITEIFDILLDNEECTDWRMLNNLYRRVSKEFMVKQSKEKTAVLVSMSQLIPHLFHKEEEVVKGNNVEIDLENAAALSSNLFMVLVLVQD